MGKTPAGRDASSSLGLRLTPWRFVVWLGVVSLCADIVYEGARSIIGPYLATLGASAVVVGAAAGAGEFIGYGLRVVSGYLVTRSRHYWAWTITGYALTVLSVPLIGATSALVPALLLYGMERLGKAVRSPAKDTLLSYASTRTGSGTAFGVHQAMDQTGAVAGPLLLAAVLAWRDGDYRLAFGVLIVPGLAVLCVLAWLRRRVPDPGAYEADASTIDADSGPHPGGAVRLGERPERLPILMWRYVAAIGVLSFGIASFPLLAFHAQTQGLLSDAQIPVLFAVAMLVDGASGPVVGRLYDRRGPQVLLLVPVAAAAASIAFTNNQLLVWVGVAIWGVVNGILDSTIKAAVTRMVPGGSRARAFGWLALVRGIGLLAAGTVLGLAYDRRTTLVILLILLANAVGLGGLWSVLRAANGTQSVH
jgi:MFS family permease